MEIVEKYLAFTKIGQGDTIRTCNFLDPNETLYQIEATPWNSSY